MPLAQLLITALVLALLIWRLRARWKTYVGRQPFSAKRMITHLAVFGGATLVVAALARRHFEALESFGGGIVLGAALAILGLRLTCFEFTPTGNYYTPSTHLGAGLTLLLGVQVIYRQVAIYRSPAGSGSPPSVFDNWPVFVMLGVTAGYFVAYNAGVLVRGRRGHPKPD